MDEFLFLQCFCYVCFKLNIGYGCALDATHFISIQSPHLPPLLLHAAIRFPHNLSMRTVFHTFRLTAILLACAYATVARGGDWPQFLGPHRNGAVTGETIRTNWKNQPPKKQWEQKVGSGFSGPIISDKTVFLYHRLGTQSTLDSIDLKSGERNWRYQHATQYRDDFGFDNGPRATPCVDGVALVGAGVGVNSPAYMPYVPRELEPTLPPASRNAFYGRAAIMFAGMRRNSPSRARSLDRVIKGPHLKSGRERSVSLARSLGSASNITQAVPSSDSDEAVHVPKVDACAGASGPSVQAAPSVVRPSPFAPGAAAPSFSVPVGGSPFGGAMSGEIEALKQAVASLSLNVAMLLEKQGVKPVEAAAAEVKKRKASEALSEMGGSLQLDGDVDEDPMGACPDLPPEENEVASGAGSGECMDGFQSAKKKVELARDSVMQSVADGTSQAVPLDSSAQDFLHSQGGSSSASRAAGAQACG